VIKQTASPNTVLCAGRLYCDMVFTGAPNLPEMGTEVFCEGLSVHAGGGAFITAAAFRALGWDTAILGTLPAAPFDAVLLADIERFGLSAGHCYAAPEQASPQVTVAIAGAKDRAFLSNKSGSAFPDVSLANQGFRHLHVGELRSWVEHPGLGRAAREAGMTISVDCGWDAELLAQGSSMTELLQDVDVFLPNDVEFEHLVNSGFLVKDAPVTVVKCGAEGAKVFDAQEWSSRGVSPVDVVDTTGAGDAFNGGFLSSWLDGQVLRDCLDSGNECGRLAVQQAGGTGGLLNLKATVAANRAGAAQ